MAAKRESFVQLEQVIIAQQKASGGTVTGKFLRMVGSMEVDVPLP